MYSFFWNIHFCKLILENPLKRRLSESSEAQTAKKRVGLSEPSENQTAKNHIAPVQPSENLTAKKRVGPSEPSEDQTAKKHVGPGEPTVDKIAKKHVDPSEPSATAGKSEDKESGGEEPSNDLDIDEEIRDGNL